MHRSGTSLVTSLLHAAGVAFGETLITANAGNPRGYFEDVDFYEFHEALLHSRQKSYLYPESIDTDFAATAAEQQRATDLIRSRQMQSLWGWKDPRTALFLDFWQALIPGGRFLCVYRHPLAVLRSLLRRGDFAGNPNPLAGLEAWCAYNRRIARLREQHPDACLLVPINALVSRFERLGDLLCDRWKVQLKIDPEICSQTFHHSELDQRPFSVDAIQILDRVYPEVLELYERLNRNADLVPHDETAVADGDNDSFLVPLASAVKKWPAFTPLIAKQAAIGIISGSLAPEATHVLCEEFSDGLRQTKRRVDDLWMHSQHLERELESRNQIIHDQEKRVKELTQELDSLRNTRESAGAAEIAFGEVVASCGLTQDQARLNNIRHLTGFQSVYSAPAELRMPERVALYGLVFGLQPKHCLEIGTFRGGSTAIICGALDDTGFGDLACVDPLPQVEPELWSRLSGRCRMFEGPSPDILTEVGRQVAATFEFAFIDGNHTYDYVRRDVLGVLPLMADDAHLLFHDGNYPDVKRAIDELVTERDELTDCGLISIEPTLFQNEDGVTAYAGLRLLRFQRLPQREPAYRRKWWAPWTRTE